MIQKLKQLLYFPIASYFRFFAAIRLRRWKPRILVVTGSNGKTTLFKLLEAQFGERARYSRHANSSFGVPFNILGLERETLLKTEWFKLFLLAPFRVFAPVPKESIYIVECDCYQPGVGKFLGELLRPEVVLWISIARTHSMNFDALVPSRFDFIEEAIAYEFGYLLEYCSKLAVIDGDSSLELRQTKRTQANVVKVKKANSFEKSTVRKDGTAFHIKKQSYFFPGLLPEEVFYSIAMCREATSYFDVPFDSSFAQFILPPGRGSIFDGVKNTILIDSSYNANLQSVEVMLHMFTNFPVKKKWVVISDMLELGAETKEEHEKLADVLQKGKFAKIILLGPRTARFTSKKLEDSRNVVSFSSLREVKDYLDARLTGGEAILFKGSQSMYLEAVIESLLSNKADIKKLPRRGAFWDGERKKAFS